MSWISPLGFLGLLGILVLILIYLLKPNYQQKFISSTFVWKLSLKYKKKRLPISKLRNILLIICQVLIITACAFIFAQPIIERAKEEKPEKILIIDASVSMRTELDTEKGVETRFDRAVKEAKTLMEDVIDDGGTVSVILAGNEASFVLQRVNSSSELSAEAADTMAALTLTNYGTADIEGAMELAETVLFENPKSEVVLYTGTDYIEKGNVTVVNVAKTEEWNAAILDCRATIQENLYVFEVDVACYNNVSQMKVWLEINGANGKGDDGYYEVYQTIKPEVNKTERVRFDAAFWDMYRDQDTDTGAWIFSFTEAYVYVETTGGDDCYSLDDTFYLFGGEKERLDFQYYSALANPFYDGALGSVGEVMRKRWDIYLDTVKEALPAVEGFDFYLFEAVAMDYIPEDGVVFVADPVRVPRGLELQLGNAKLDLGQEVPLTAGAPHDITKYVTAEHISVRAYTPIDWYDETVFTPLMYCNGKPIMLVKNQPDSKVIIFTGDVHYSDLAVRYEFPIMMYNIIEYFFPETIEKRVFEVGETVKLNARGENLEMIGPKEERNVYEDLPVEITLPVDVKGIYHLNQTLINGEPIDEFFYVKTPASESNICKIIDELKNPYFEPPKEKEDNIQELLIYFLAGLVALMFIEWWLQSRENM